MTYAHPPTFLHLHPLTYPDGDSGDFVSPTLCLEERRPGTVAKAAGARGGTEGRSDQERRQCERHGHGGRPVEEGEWRLPGAGRGMP